jgi:hypothetical protein
MMGSINAMGNEVDFDFPTNRCELKTKKLKFYKQGTFYNKTGVTGPCARDGHSANVYKRNLVIFGGDRHQMQFKDIFMFNLGSLS